MISSKTLSRDKLHAHEFVSFFSPIQHILKINAILHFKFFLVSTLRTSFTWKGNITVLNLSIFLPSSTKIHIFAWSGRQWSAHILTICLYRRTGKYMHICLSVTGISSTSSNTATVSKSRAHSQLLYFFIQPTSSHPVSVVSFHWFTHQPIIPPFYNITLKTHSQPHLHRRSWDLESILSYPGERHTTSGHQQLYAMI